MIAKSTGHSAIQANARRYQRKLLSAASGLLRIVNTTTIGNSATITASITLRIAGIASWARMPVAFRALFCARAADVAAISAFASATRAGSLRIAGSSVPISDQKVLNMPWRSALSAVTETPAMKL